MLIGLVDFVYFKDGVILYLRLGYYRVDQASRLELTAILLPEPLKVLGW